MPARSARVLAAPCASAHSASRLLHRSGSAATLASMAILIFSQTRGTANQSSAAPRAVRPRSSAGPRCGDLDPADRLEVLREARSAMCAEGRNEVIRSPNSTSTTCGPSAEIASHAAVRELDSLRRPGGAGGVDQGQRRRRAPRPARSRRSRSPAGHRLELGQRDVPSPSPSTNTTCSTAAASPGRGCRGRPARDDHAVLRVAEEVLDLLGRGGVVDRERDCPRCMAAASTTANSGPVGEHDADGVAAAYAERVQALGDLRAPGRRTPPRSG